MTLVVNSKQPSRVIAAGDGPGILVNRDITNLVWLYGRQGFDSNSAEASILDPLVGVPFDGKDDQYAVTKAGTNQTAVIDYIKKGKSWTPSPAQQAAQLNALGLAKDSSVNAPGYGPVTLTNAGLLALEGGGNLQTLLNQAQSGIAPRVTGTSVFNSVSQGTAGSPTQIVAAGGNPLSIWSIALDYSVATLSAYVAGTATLYAAIRLFHLGSMTDYLAILDHVVTVAGQQAAESYSQTLHGLVLAAGDSLVLDVNGAVAVANVAQRASAIVVTE